MILDFCLLDEKIQNKPANYLEYSVNSYNMWIKDKKKFEFDFYIPVGNYQLALGDATLIYDKYHQILEWQTFFPLKHFKDIKKNNCGSKANLIILEYFHQNLDNIVKDQLVVRHQNYTVSEEARIFFKKLGFLAGFYTKNEDIMFVDEPFWDYHDKSVAYAKQKNIYEPLK